MATFVSNPATIIKATASGATGAGPISISGLLAGDLLMLVEPAGFAGGLEQSVSVANQIQQFSNADWSSVNFTFYLLRGV